MKTTARLRSFLILAGSALLAASSLHAATLYWDGGTVNIGTNGDGLSGGTAGDWNNALTNWDQGIGLAHIAWSAGSSAVFGGTADTVTLTDNISVGGLQFDTTGYTIDTNGNTLTFGAADNTITLANIATATITGAVTGSGNVILNSSDRTAAGTLTLNGTSTGGWSGTTTVNAGATLALAGANQALLNTSGITLNGGGITLTNVDGTEGALDRVSNSAGITSNGGTFTYANTAGSGLTYAETIGSLDLVSGQFNTVLTNNMNGGGGNVQTLTLSGLTRTGGSNTSVVTFAGNGGLNTTTNIIQVNGIATSTTAGDIIGPWATYGTPSAGQTDYAVYNSDGTFGRIENASISASAENTWGSGANVTLGGNTTLTATRTLNSLRYSGGVGTLNLGAANFNLETYGLLNGGSGLTVSTTGTGGLTTPTGGGNLYLTTGSAAITVSAPIIDNGGAVTLVKSGSATSLATATLTLSGTNTYSGGTVINAGRVGIISDANLGAASGSVTMNGAELYITNSFSSTREIVLNSDDAGTANVIRLQGNGNWTNSGAFTGSGGVTFQQNPNGGVTATLTSANNTFTGALGILASNGAITVTLRSLADAPGAGNIVFGASTQLQTFQWDSVAPNLVLDYRRVQFAGNGNAKGVINNNSTSTSITINTDLLNTGSGTKTLEFNSVALPTNVFAGDISDGSGGGTVVVSKTGVGTWLLGGTNTYSGATTLVASGTTGRLIFQGSQSLSPNTQIDFNQNSSAVQSISLLDDGVGTIGSPINFQRPITFVGANTTQVMNVFVGNTSNGTGSGTTTGSVIGVGDITWNNATQAGNTTRTFNVTSANGYTLKTGNFILPNLSTRSAGGTWTNVMNPTTGTLIIGGNVTMASGNNVSGGIPVLELGGLASGNQVIGSISDAADVGTTLRPLSLTKTGASDWTLFGTNTYSGTTTVSGGILIFSGSSSMSSASALSVGANGNVRLVDGTAFAGSTTSALTLASGAVLAFDWVNGATDTLTSTAAASTVAGAVGIGINPVGTPSGGPHTLISSAGGGLNTATYYLSNNTNFTATLAQSDTAVTINGYAAASVLADAYWKGGVLAGALGSMNFSDSTTSNWTTDAAGATATGTIPGGGTTNVIFSATGATQQSAVNISSPLNIGSITFNDGTAITISGGFAITLNNTATTAATTTAARATITNAGLNAISAITVTSFSNATSTINTPVSLAGTQTWNIANGKKLIIGGALDGLSPLTIAGGNSSSNVTLNGVSTFDGDINITGGVLQIGTNNTANGAVLGGGNYSGDISIASGATLHIQSNATQTISGVISGDGDFIKSYTGTLTLGDTNTYTGKTSIKPLTTAGAGTLEVTSFNSVNGGTPLLASSSLGAPTTVANGTIDLGGGAQGGAALRYTGGGETTDRVINFATNGNGAGKTMDASGSGLLKFTSTATTSGGSTGNDIILTGTGNGEFVGGLNFQFRNFTKSGAGTWTLGDTVNSGSSTGTNAISAGTLILRGSGGLASTGATTLSANAALIYYAKTDAAMTIGGTLAITGGTSTTIGGSIGSTFTSGQINVAGNATSTAAALKVNIYGNSFSATTDGTGTYTLVQGGGTNTLNNAILSLGTVYNNTNFTVGALGQTANDITVGVTTATALTAAYWTGGLTGSANVWAASDGSTASNWVTAAGGGATSLVPGSGADVYISANSVNFAPTATVLGADMSINSLTISDNSNDFALNSDGYALTIGSGGITKSNTTTHTATIGADVVLGAAQTWSNSDTGNALVVSGIVTGANDLIVTGAGNTTVTGRLMTDAGTLTKTGNGTLALASNNTYNGATTVNAGTLLVSGYIGSSAVTVSNAGTVLASGATGTIGNTVDINNGAILAAGGHAAAGTATALGATTFNNGSIFSWDISANGLSYDKLIAPSLVDGDAAGGSVFRIVVADNTFADGFWSTAQSWTNIFTTDGSTAITDWADIFTTVSVVESDLTTAATLPSGYSFTVSGNTLNYSAIPEPTSALAGLLLTAGLLRRRRTS